MNEEQIREIVREEIMKVFGSSFSIPLSVDQSIRARFRIPIIVKKTLDFADTSIQSGSSQTVDIPGTSVGDLVVITPPSGAIVGNLGGIFTAYVSSTGVVTIRFFNPSTTSSLNPSSGEFTIAVFKP